MSQNLPLKGTAALARPLVKGCNLSPAPPAINMASTLFIADLFLPFKNPVNRNKKKTPMISNDGYRATCHRKSLGLSMLSLSDPYQCYAQSVFVPMAVVVPMLVAPTPQQATKLPL